MKVLEIIWPFALMGILLVFGALKIRANAKKKSLLAISARVIKAKSRFEPGIYKTRAFAYDLIIEYTLNGSTIQKTIPSMEHFPENSIIQIIPMENRIEIATKTPCGPLTNIYFDIVLLCIAMFVFVSGIEMALIECQANPILVDMCSSIPSAVIAAVFSWCYVNKKKQKHNNLFKTKVTAKVVEHRLERRTEKNDRMHNILSYEYNQLLYLFDYVTPPSIALAMNASIDLAIDAKSGFVINLKKNEMTLKAYSLIAKVFWILTGLNIVLSLI